MLLVPSGKAALAAAAAPATSALVLNGTALARNITSPIGVPAPELTVAVKVTLAPGSDGLPDEVNRVVVGWAPTVSA